MRFLADLRVRERLNKRIGGMGFAKGTPSCRCYGDTLVNRRSVAAERVVAIEEDREEVDVPGAAARVLSRAERTLHADELNILYFVTALRSHLSEW